ncbi:MAG: SDR family oxidoreductase [Spirochaeta sp.]
MTFGITGVTGEFGGYAVQHMIDMGVKPADIVGLARSKEKAADLIDKGVTIRLGDYDEPDTLKAAFKGVDRLLLVSGSEIGKRSEQHRNVIQAAGDVGVLHIVYTSITKADRSPSPMAPEHRDTEAALASSGLSWTILRNNWYTENYQPSLAGARESGVISAAIQHGRVASALKTEFAEAAARTLLHPPDGEQIYELAGPAWTYQELAEAAGKALGTTVKYQPVSKEQRIKDLQAAGMPGDMAGFFAEVDASIDEGALDIESDDLPNILGRPVTGLSTALASFS